MSAIKTHASTIMVREMTSDGDLPRIAPSLASNERERGTPGVRFVLSLSRRCPLVQTSDRKPYALRGESPIRAGSARCGVCAMALRKRQRGANGYGKRQKANPGRGAWPGFRSPSALSHLGSRKEPSLGDGMRADMRVPRESRPSFAFSRAQADTRPQNWNLLVPVSGAPNRRRVRPEGRTED
jgi:hypothetical protein